VHAVHSAFLINLFKNVVKFSKNVIIFQFLEVALGGKMNFKLTKGRPADMTDRLQNEIKTYDLLDACGVEYETLEHEAAFTMEACEAVDRALNVTMCKNLFLCNRQKTAFYLLLMPGDKVFKTKELSSQINSARLSFADAEAMEKYLGVTPGSVSIFGLINDTDHAVRLLVDEDTLNSDFIGCHPCINTASVKLSCADLFGPVVKALYHEITTVKLIGEE